MELKDFPFKNDLEIGQFVTVQLLPRAVDNPDDAYSSILSVALDVLGYETVGERLTVVGKVNGFRSYWLSFDAIPNPQKDVDTRVMNKDSTLALKLSYRHITMVI